MEDHFRFLDPSACAGFFSRWQSCAKELWSRDRILRSRDSRDKEHKDKHNFFCSLLGIIENDVKPSPILFYDGARDERATVTTSLYFFLVL